MKFSSIILFIIWNLSTNAQPSELRQGNILHYKGFLIVNDDTSHSKKISDFAIRVDTLIRYKEGSGLLLFSRYFDDVYSPSKERNKTIFLFFNQKIYTILVNNLNQFINDYSKNILFWNRQLKDSVDINEAYKDFKDKRYDFTPFLNLKDAVPCRLVDSINMVSNTDNLVSFACFKRSYKINVFNSMQKIKVFTSEDKRASDTYHYSNNLGIVHVVGEDELQGKIYSYSLSLDKIQ
ncbi:MAG TPA: hypothetical protein VG738_24165 [Chitinophagaceae bacterium]|nr:hypothetical protein [Chitinophagaceae bacterium]